MTRSTPRTGLPRAAAFLIALALAAGWSQSGLAYSTEADGGRPAGALTVADPQLRQPTSSFQWLVDLHEQREDLRTDAAQAAQAQLAPKAESKPVVAKATAAKPTYSGRNRFWIPLLGMSYRVHLFECTRSRPPDNYIYRWGCAGTNNLYILGHAYGVMKPLHDLYVRGKLKLGMVAIYADGSGHVHWYRVTSWRVVDPVDSAWAIASQPVPSMTLQTCVGKDGRYRLNVRLVQFR